MTITPTLIPPTPPPPAPQPTPEQEQAWQALAEAAAEKAAARAAGPLYQVEADSLSRHDCCFAATVIRTDLPAHAPEASICETHDIETAQRIADLLNAAHEHEVSRETSPPDPAR